MELVSSSKLRKAKQRAEQARPYFNELYKSMCEIASANTDFSTVFTQKREIKHRLFIVVAGDRGLAGGYNSNVLKLAAAAHADDAEKPKIIAIGKKSIEYFSKRDYDIVGSYPNIAENIKPAQAQRYRRYGDRDVPPRRGGRCAGVLHHVRFPACAEP